MCDGGAWHDCAAGQYQVRLTVGDDVQTQSFAVLADPRVSTSAADMAEQAALCSAIRDKISAGNAAINRIRDVEAQVDGVIKRANDEAIVTAAKAAKQTLIDAENPLLVRGHKTFWQGFNTGSRIIAKFGNLLAYVAAADMKPTEGAYEHFDFLSAEFDPILKAVDDAIAQEVGALNEQLAANSTPVIFV